MKDYYDILQVSPNAEQEVIDAAYRRLARKYHPDVYSGSDAADRMREFNEAHEVLGDRRRRAEYDAALGRAHARAGAGRAQEDAPSPPPPPPPPPPPDPQHPRPARPARTPAAGRVRLALGLVGVVGLATAGVWVAVGAVPEGDDSSPTRTTGGFSPTPTAAAALADAGTATASTPAAAAQQPEQQVTQTYRYAPSVAVAVQPRSEENSCWTSSIASGRHDAFRCVMGNLIHDPCFTYGPDTLVCPYDPRTTDDDLAFTFNVSSVTPLAPRARFLDTIWFMVVNGEGCYAVTGTRPFVGEKYYDFSCPGARMACTAAAQGRGGYVSDCWNSDSGAENTYTVAEVWY